MPVKARQCFCCAADIQNRVRTQNDSRIHSVSHICCTNKNDYFSYFLIIFISKIHIFNKIFIQCYLRTKMTNHSAEEMLQFLCSLTMSRMYFFICVFLFESV